ncbi:MAG TPA: HD domain-containing protein, partial [Pirellulales bacterium]
FRDPLYDYIRIERGVDGWLLELLETAEVQRLRRIHQLGMSHFTYTGAEHSRLSHSLGVVHLMQEALSHLRNDLGADREVTESRRPLLAAALLHDVGHGPFSHLFEGCLGLDHESWSCLVVNSPETEVHQVLKKHGIQPWEVTELIRDDGAPGAVWRKSLLSSQLDVDRLDYLRRDSLFTGAGFGHYDYYRLLHSFTLDDSPRGRDLVWTMKAAFAVEEYIFARFYMYNTVYMHKTTRGYERLLQQLWKRAEALEAAGNHVEWLPAFAEFRAAKRPNAGQYLALEEFSTLAQIQTWTKSGDRALSDLARRFLARRGFVAVDAPSGEDPLRDDYTEWEATLQQLVGGWSEFQPADCYVVRDDMRTNIYTTVYVPKAAGEWATSLTTIRIRPEDGGPPVEISQLLPRIAPVVNRQETRVRYYLPREARPAALKLRAQWTARG